MSIFSAIKRAFMGDVAPPTELDFLPVGNTDARTKAKIDAARKRYGKPFAGELKVARRTGPSFILQNINEQSMDARKVKASVTHIHGRKADNAKEK